MLRSLLSNRTAEWASAAQVVVISVIAGRMAAEGMNMIQWLGALTAVLGSISLAALVWTQPEPKKVPVERRRED